MCRSVCASLFTFIILLFAQATLKANAVALDTIPPNLIQLVAPPLETFCPEELTDEQAVLDRYFDGIFPYELILDGPGDIHAATVWQAYYPTGCNERGYIEWAVTDLCGNTAINGNAGAGSRFIIEWIVDASATAPLDWIGSPDDFLPPEDFTVQFRNEDCTNDFDPCLWKGQVDGSNIEEFWIWELIRNVHYEGGCDVSVFYTHTPCSDTPIFASSRTCGYWSRICYNY